MQRCKDYESALARKQDWGEDLKRFDSLKKRPYNLKVEYSLELLREAKKRFKKICVACSFGKDSLVILHLAMQIWKKPLVVFNNTGVEYPETLKHRDLILEQWDIDYTEVKPETNFFKIAKEYGYPQMRWKNRTPKCCFLLKEKPASKFYKDNDIECTIVGITWDESYMRRWLAIRYKDQYYVKKEKINKVLPILYWDIEDVWRYTRENNIPINKAYEKTDRVGCMPCTGFIGWEAKMARMNYKLYKKVSHDLGQNLIEDF